MRAVDAVEWAYVLRACLIQNEWVEQQIYITFCMKHEHSSMETIRMIQKATAMGNWWLEGSLWQHVHSCINPIQSFSAKHQITQVTQLPYNPYLAPCNFWLFPKLKSPFKGKRFQTINEIQENIMGSWWQTEEQCEAPRCLLWKGLRFHCPVHNVSFLNHFH